MIKKTSTKILIFVALNFFPLNIFCNEFKFSITPFFAQVGGNYSFQFPFNKENKGETFFKQFSNVHIGVNLELTLRNKIICGSGYGSSFPVFPFDYPFISIIRTDTLSPNHIIITKTYGKRLVINDRVINRIPIYINYPLFWPKFRPENSENNNEKVKALPFLHLGASLLKLKSSNGGEFDDFKIYSMYGNTIKAYANHEDINYSGVSVDFGINFNFIREERTLGRLFIHYDLGLISLFKENFYVERNGTIIKRESMIGRGNQIKFGIAFPVTAFRKTHH